MKLINKLFFNIKYDWKINIKKMGFQRFVKRWIFLDIKIHNS